MPPTDNPLLQTPDRIPFDRIKACHVAPGIREILSEANAALDELTAQTDLPNWENTIARLDAVTEQVKQRTVPVGHLIGVVETPELREAYNEVLPEMSQFWTSLTLNEALWERIRRFAESSEGKGLSGIRRRHLETVVRDFRRAGAELGADEKVRLADLRTELARLHQRFSENVLDATNAFKLLVTDEKRLTGVPAVDRDQAQRKAEDAGMVGWLLTLDYPSFEPIIKYADDRSLRRELYEAFVGRCMDGEFANVEVIDALLRLRGEMAALLGYRDFADYRLEDHMAKTGQAAADFISDMTEKASPYWKRDYAQLVEHAATLELSELAPWDVAFVSESLRRRRFAIDDEALRPYFPLDRVLRGLFELVSRVFGLTVNEVENSAVWDPAVRFYDLIDKDGTHLGSFYTDWLPRPNKRQGAWMHDLVTGGPRESGFVPHVGIIAGNLTPPKGTRPSLLTHREVEIIFHEFGHLLHHLTSRVAIAPMAGINVAWDFVELPSQLMENWAWEEEALPLFSGHFETGEPLPKEVFDRMTEARRFMGGWSQMRQLSLGYTDMALHRCFDPTSGADVLDYVEGLLVDYSPGPEFARYHSTTSFTHLFTGGYAAAYYSYLWSEVLEADAFGRFRSEGILDQGVGRAFMDAILTRGDSDDPEVLFRDFMGREPDPQALLDRNLGAL